MLLRLLILCVPGHQSGAKLKDPVEKSILCQFFKSAGNSLQLCGIPIFIDLNSTLNKLQMFIPVQILPVLTPKEKMVELFEKIRRNNSSMSISS